MSAVPSGMTTTGSTVIVGLDQAQEPDLAGALAEMAAGDVVLVRKP